VVAGNDRRDDTTVTRRRTYRWAPILATALGAALMAACGSSGSGASSATYGPSWARFTAAFPSTPQAATSSEIQEIKAQFTSASEVAGYALSPQKDIFAAKSPVPGPVTFGVVIVRYPQASTVSQNLSLLKSHLSGATSLTVAGHPAIRLIGLAKTSPLTAGQKLTDPSATVGIELVGHGSTLFIVQVVTTSTSAASTLLKSFKPT
jgi:hypothetical protein